MMPTGRCSNRRWQLSHDVVEHRRGVGHRALITLQHLGAWRSAAPAPPCVSLNSRTFSIAITAWSAKVRSSAMCLSSKGFTSVRRTSDRRRCARRRAAAARPAWCGGRAGVPVRCTRGHSSCAAAGRATCTAAPVDDRPAHDGAAVQRHRFAGGAPRSPKTATPRIVSPSRRMMSTNCASQILAARSAIASNTGCTSAGEPADHLQDLGWWRSAAAAPPASR